MIKAFQTMKPITLLLAISLSSTISAQKLDFTTASSQQVAHPVGNMLPFDISANGVEQPVRWGIDTAWRWSWWPLRATNHMRECVSLGRVTIDPRWGSVEAELSDAQRNGLDEQLGWLKKSGVKDLYLLSGNVSGTRWQTSYRDAFINDIALAVQYLQRAGYNVIAISPFNEPDYSANNAPDAAEMARVAVLMHQNSVLKDIDLTGPNCLNPDYSYAWWSTMKDAVQIGNTHQLAGSFDNFAGFYDAVHKAGKKSCGDEMHNINDALIGMNYGMSAGIWWSDFGAYTRAELGRASNDGVRIGYKENRAAWTSAAVFRRKSEPMVEAFLGSSERQAGESAFTFVSQDRLAYFDGHGPYYEYTKATAGGTGYQKGQTNSEYVIEILHGEDVPVGPIEGNFKIVNKATKKLLTIVSGSVNQSTESKTKAQSWAIAPVGMRDAGDFACVTMANAKSTTSYLDAKKYEADNGAGIIMYSGGGNECERWHLHYKGDGYYVITNNDSGLSLEGSSNNTPNTSSAITQWERTGTDRQLWRFVPADATVEWEAPAVPQGLKAVPTSGSITLSWEANTDADLLGYMVNRYNEAAEEWETIARRVTTTQFVDNTCAKLVPQRYRIRAVDKAWNVGEPSQDITATTTDEKTLIAEWPFSTNLSDATSNHNDAVGTSGLTYLSSDAHNGLSLNGTSDYVSLPYRIGELDEMTFSAWVKMGQTTAWQRIFDFGRSTDNYLFLTNSNGSRLRYEICKDGTKQGLNATKTLSKDTWTHVVLTTGKGGTKIYLDGVLNASSDAVTLVPSDIAPTMCFLGRSMFDADPLLKGCLGDVCLYNYVMQEDDVKALFYHDQIVAAEEMAGRPMYNETKSALQVAIAEAEDAIASGQAPDIEASLKALATAMSKAETSAKTYQSLGAALDWSAQLVAAHPQQDADAQQTYSEACAQLQNGYATGLFANTQIATAVQDVRAQTFTYLMTDTRTTATEEKPVDITYLLQNPDFADNTYDGWTISGSGYTPTVNYNVLEVFNHTFNISQSLPGMPSGTYRLDAQAFYRNGAKENAANTTVNAQLFIGTATAAILPIASVANNAGTIGDWYAYETGKKVPNDLQAAANAFGSMKRYRPTAEANTLTADYDATATASLKVGIKKTKTVAQDWMAINYFKLYFLGNKADAIDVVTTEAQNPGRANVVYDLSGRRVQKPSHGIYIIGGRKVIR